MKIYKTNKRISGITQHFGAQTHKTTPVTGSVENIQEFLKLYPPVKSSSNLIAAIEKAFIENGSIVFNCGNGNQKFYFKESL